MAMRITSTKFRGKDQCFRALNRCLRPFLEIYFLVYLYSYNNFIDYHYRVGKVIIKQQDIVFDL